MATKKAALKASRVVELDPSTEVAGIFDGLESKLWIHYEVECQFTSLVMAGTPARADVIAGFIRAKMGVDSDTELAAMVKKTLGEIGVETPDAATLEDVIKASESIASERHGNVFKRDQHGLYLETRQVKSGLKEATNVLYAGERWGKTKKGPKNAISEWIFLHGQRIYLGRERADGQWTQHGVVSGPSGSRSTLTQYEYVDKPRITFILKSLVDPANDHERISPDQWAMLLGYLQYSGLGALRSQSHGQFKVVGFTRVDLKA
jgi:hypothetical protein